MMGLLIDNKFKHFITKHKYRHIKLNKTVKQIKRRPKYSYLGLIRTKLKTPVDYSLTI
jgi:hypothetical protein